MKFESINTKPEQPSLTERFIDPSKRKSASFEPWTAETLGRPLGKMEQEVVDEIRAKQEKFKEALESFLEGKNMTTDSIMISRAFDGKEGEIAMAVLDTLRRSAVTYHANQNQYRDDAEKGLPVSRRTLDGIDIKNMKIGIAGNPEEVTINLLSVGALHSTAGIKGLGTSAVVKSNNRNNLNISYTMPGFTEKVINEKYNGRAAPDGSGDGDVEKYMDIQSVEGKGPFMQALLRAAIDKYRNISS